MSDDMRTFMDRPKRYDNIDGTGEMYLGLMLLGFALLGYLRSIIPEHSIWKTNFLANLAFMYGILIPVLALGWLLQRWVKKHITFPRTGYVVYGIPDAAHAPTVHRFWSSPWAARLAIAIPAALISGIAGAILAVLTVAGKNHDGAITFARVGYSAIWAPLYAFWIYRMGREHVWKWLALALMALGLVALNLLVPGGITELSRPMSLFVGLVWVGSGAVTLAVYIHRHHLPGADTPRSESQ